VVLGEECTAFEREFADFCGVKHCVGVGNGLDALHLVLRAWGIGAQDEVIVPSHTFIATWLAVSQTGAQPVPVEPEALSAAMAPDLVEAAITPRTRAIVAVHLYGRPAHMGPLREIAQRHGLKLLEDAAQAHGARIGGRAVGSFGVGCFSLYATKNFTTGEGGLITTSDAALADRLRLLRNQGMRKRYEYEIPGYNYRMTDVQAAIGIPQLQRAEAVTAARQRNAAWLTDALDGILGLVTPQAHAGRNHVFHQYTVRITQDAPVTRDEFIERLGELGVGCGIYYPRAVYDYACYRDHPRVVADHTPNAEQAAREVVSIPVHPALTESDRARVAECVRKAVGA
jgi:dTDP-4-amino-4,6-dideoxygalactose transaminase